MSRESGPGTEVTTRRDGGKPTNFLTRRGLPVALGVGVLLVGAFWTMRMRGLVLALAVVGVVAVLTSVVRMANRFAEQSNQRPDEPSDAVKQQKRALSRCQYLESIDPAMAEKALAQFEQNEDRSKKFRAVLAAKFEPGELTYQRYLSAAEQLHQALFENLSDVTVMLNNLDSLAVREARKELAILERFAQLSEDEARTASGLRERLAIAERTEAEVRSRLAYNETALTELDRVNLALSSIKTSKSTSNVDLEATMNELRELAERAKKYSL
ncbi:hypothetical protein D3C87_807620 [compost metagenome]